MKKYSVIILVAVALTVSLVIIIQKAQAQDANSQGAMTADTSVPKAASQQGSAIYVTEIPPEYRDWKFISLAREEGKLDDIRAILGNDIAIKAYRDGTRPFPEGAMIARLAYGYVASEDNNKIFGSTQSFVAGAPKNGVQFMVKDSKKYASTGGWGYGQFNDGKNVGAAMLTSCFPCHEAFKDHDFVFTHYAP